MDSFNWNQNLKWILMGMLLLLIASATGPVFRLRQDLLDAVQKMRVEDQALLRDLTKRMREASTENDALLDEIRDQQNALSIESLLETESIQRAIWVEGDSLREVEVAIPEAQKNLLELQEKFRGIAAPEESEVKLGLRAELSQKEAELQSFQSRYLLLIDEQRAFAGGFIQARNQFMSNWWDREWALENQLEQVRGQIRLLQFQSEKMAERISKETELILRLEQNLQRQ